jgi:hypothetical protein
MLKRRFFSTLFFALALLFAQQGSTLHALRHVLAEQAEQQKKQTPSTHDCEQCISYAQIGGALNSSYLTFALHAALSHTLALHPFVFLTQYALSATARGPPSLQIPV